LGSSFVTSVLMVCIDKSDSAVNQCEKCIFLNESRHVDLEYLEYFRGFGLHARTQERLQKFYEKR
jgi:hypothetical protein